MKPLFYVKCRTCGQQKAKQSHPFICDVCMEAFPANKWGNRVGKVIAVLSLLGIGYLLYRLFQ